MTVTFSADGYTSKTENAPAIAIVQAMGTITWDNPYTTGDLTVPATRTIANVPTIDSPSGTTLAYSTNSASICTVASNGTITAKGAGSCVVTATFSKTGFANETKNAAAITIIDGTMGTITWNNAYASGELVDS